MYELVVIGASLGGLEALKILFSELLKELSFPLALVLHRHSDFDKKTLMAQLQKVCKSEVIETKDKQKIEPNKIYLAPSNYHLLIERESFALSIDEAVSMARPSIDVLFESAADIYKEKVIGIVLTGANHDGAKGLARIKELGGLAVVQDPKTAECRMMPEAAIESTGTDQIMSVKKIADLLSKLCLEG